MLTVDNLKSGTRFNVNTSSITLCISRHNLPIIISPEESMSNKEITFMVIEFAENRQRDIKVTELLGW